MRKAARDAIDAIRRPDNPKQATAGLLDRLTAIEKHNQELEKKLKDLTDKVDALKELPKKTEKGADKQLENRSPNGGKP